MVSLSEGYNGKTLSYEPPAELPASELRSLYVRQCEKRQGTSDCRGGLGTGPKCGKYDRLGFDVYRTVLRNIFL